MRESEIPVKFEPQGKIVHVLAGTTLLEAAVRAGLLLDSPCGGRGTCGKCRVRVVDASGEATPAERAKLTAGEIAQGMRLACQRPVTAPVTVEVPETSLLASTFKILGGKEGAIVDVSRAAVRKQYVTLAPPARDDEMPDLERLQRALGQDFRVSLSMLRELPQRLRKWNFAGTAVLADHLLIDFEEGDTTGESYVLAVDLGTTTIVAVLLDLNTGRECGMVARMNPQTRFGDDVISRILHARQSSTGLLDLRDAVVSEVNDMVRELCRNCDTRPERVYEAVFSGNTTMQQLFAGVDPSALGEVPFVPAVGRGMQLHRHELNLHIHPEGRAYLFPVIGGFVGGDTVAGLIATEMAAQEKPAVLLDIGTNGEIVISHKGRMIATSTAAGPAFEGARITFGMRATAGAIEKVIFDGAIRINVIGDVPPVGLCGSALVDAIAELLRSGALIQQGLLLSPGQMKDDVPAWVRERIVEDSSGAAFVLATAEESGIDGPILLTQRDIREVQVATAAMRAGLNILLRRAGLDVPEIDRVLLAGGFGNFIRRRNAQRIGLLPSELDRHRIVFVGNASLAGARLAAASPEVRQNAETLASNVEHIDLSLDPEFQNEFVEAMMFPEYRD
jgi:uncharacterized 2Fe-2S/4Fe-4S cluster protein (DUF4445 family)